HLPANPTVACIISVNSSGSFLQFLRQSVEAVNRPLQLKLISIYAYRGAPSGSSVLCEIPHEVENYRSSEECAMCRSGSKGIQVDPRLYYIKDREEIELPLTQNYFLEGRSAILGLSQISGALRIHRDDATEGSTKHHAF